MLKAKKTTVTLFLQYFLQRTDDNEQPPFNFQGMLRKTKYNRDSMKRSTTLIDVDAIFPTNETPTTSPTNRRHSSLTIANNDVHSTPRSSNVVYHKKNRAPSPQTTMVSRRSSIVSTTKEIENAMDSMGATPLQNERKMSMPSWMEKATADAENSTDKNNVYVQEEIHPGIILEGYAVEC